MSYSTLTFKQFCRHIQDPRCNSALRSVIIKRNQNATTAAFNIVCQQENMYLGIWLCIKLLSDPNFFSQRKGL